MNPNQPYAPQQETTPQQPQQGQGGQMFGQPFTPPTPGSIVGVPQSGAQLPLGPDGKPVQPKAPISKLTIGLVASMAIELLLIFVLIAVVSNKPATDTSKSATTTSQSASPDTASSTSVQQTDDLISQDISGLNEQQDFSANAYANQALGL